MNKMIENAMLRRETAMTGSFVRGLDLVEGDIVQIRPPGHHSGRLGIITGIMYYKKKDDLRFNVMFSNREGALFTSERLERVGPTIDEA